MKNLALFVLASFMVVACAHKQPVKTERKIASNLSVRYMPENESDYTEFAMEPVVPRKTKFQIELSAVNPSNAHTCDYGGIFNMKKDKLTFENKTDACKITIKFDTKKYLKATITQEGQDFECGCGANVYLDGRVKVQKRQ